MIERFSSNFFEQTNSFYDFAANISLGISYNFKETLKGIEDLKDADPENAAKYLLLTSASGYAGAGAASPYIATYGPGAMDMMQGDSFDESMAKNSDYINDSNTIHNAGTGGSSSAGFTLELAYAQSKSGFEQKEAIANNLLSSSDINLTSQNSSLNIASSNLLAQNNINLNARKGEINITASSNDSNSFSKSFAASLSIPIIGKGDCHNHCFDKSTLRRFSRFASKSDSRLGLCVVRFTHSLNPFSLKTYV